MAHEFIDCEKCGEELGKEQRVCPACGRDRQTGNLDPAWEAEALRRDPFFHERGPWDEINRPLYMREIAWGGVWLGALATFAGAAKLLRGDGALGGLVFAVLGLLCIGLGVERISGRRRRKP